MYLATEDMVRAQPVRGCWLLDSKCQRFAPNTLSLVSAEGLHVPGALRGQGEVQFRSGIRGGQRYVSHQTQRRAVEIPHCVAEQETR